MIFLKDGHGQSNADALTLPTGLVQAMSEVCEQALSDARNTLHPLLRGNDINRLGERPEFVQAFKSALAARLAQRLAAWLPGVQAVFQFDSSRMPIQEHWDNSIHLLVMRSQVSRSYFGLGQRLDGILAFCLKQFGWTRFMNDKPVLEIQQVTPAEIQRGIGFGAMFHAVYSAPVKVWSKKGSI